MPGVVFALCERPSAGLLSLATASGWSVSILNTHSGPGVTARSLWLHPSSCSFVLLWVESGRRDDRWYYGNSSYQCEDLIKLQILSCVRSVGSTLPICSLKSALLLFYFCHLVFNFINFLHVVFKPQSGSSVCELCPIVNAFYDSALFYWSRPPGCLIYGRISSDSSFSFCWHNTEKRSDSL